MPAGHSGLDQDQAPKARGRRKLEPTGWRERVGAGGASRAERLLAAAPVPLGDFFGSAFAMSYLRPHPEIKLGAR